MSELEPEWESKLKKLMSWVAVFGVFVFSLVYFSRVAYLAVTEQYWRKVGLEHFPTLVGLPAAAIASIFIVLVLRTIAGPLEFKVLGMEFKGASGPTAFWVVCFLAISLAIKITWSLTYVSQ
jgi:hypothetical protein